MDFRNKNLLCLYITVIYFVGPARGVCKEGITTYTLMTKNVAPVGDTVTELKPSIMDVYDTFVSIIMK